MGITNELRGYVAETWDGMVYVNQVPKRLLEIADRIDAEHQKAIRELNDLADNSVLLPVDADGVPIRVGDWITGRWDAKAKVVAVTSDDVYWWEPNGCHWCHACDVRHHEPTV